MEEWTQRIAVLDKWQVWHNHLRTLLFSILLFSFYGVYLWIICLSPPSLITGLLLFLSQIGVGLPATRTYYELGMKTRSELRLTSSGPTNGENHYKETEIGVGDLPLLFERFALGVRRATKTILDDYNDLAWFAVTSWAIASTGFYYLSNLPPYVCIVSDIVLAVTCSVSYISGYWMARATSFEDELNQMEYYVIRRFGFFDSAAGRYKPRIRVLSTRRLRNDILVDFLVVLTLPGNKVVEYHMGLSSEEPERFLIEAPEDVVIGLKRSLKEDVFGPDWSLEKVRTQSGLILRLVKESQNKTTVRSYMLGPDSIDESSEGFLQVLKTLLAELVS